MLKDFLKLSELVNMTFMPLVFDVVVGVIINKSENSQYKYQFIQNVIEYLLEQTKLLDATVLKTVIQIFNLIWAVFPVLPKTWGKLLIEKTHPDTDYVKYMKEHKE